MGLADCNAALSNAALAHDLLDRDDSVLRDVSPHDVAQYLAAAEGE